MALDYSRIRMFCKMQKQYNVKGSLLSIGVQDVMATHEEIEGLMKSEGHNPKPIAPDKRKYRVSRGQQVFNAFFKVDKPMHGNDFYEMCGFDHVDSLELFDNDKPEIVHDLNHPLPSEYHGKYDALVDFGCAEHIFDVRQVMDNYIRVLKPGGIVYLYLPMKGWHNECFYNFQPPMFFDLFAANGFDDMQCYLNFFPKYFLRDKSKNLWLEYQYCDRINFYRRYCHTHLLFVARKKEEKPFTVPLMEYYLAWFDKKKSGDKDIGQEGSHYMLDNMPGPIARLVPVLAPIYKMLPIPIRTIATDFLIWIKNRKKLSGRKKFWI